MFNGGGQQQITVLLPNPHLDDRQNYVDSPDWGRLYLWDRLRDKYLGQGSDPVDRSAPPVFSRVIWVGGSAPGSESRVGGGPGTRGRR